MKIKTADLTGPALDWAVAKCEGVPLVYRGRKWPTDGATTIEYAPWSVNPVVNGAGPYVASLCRDQYSPSVDWSQGGPIIEREKISVEIKPHGYWMDSFQYNYAEEKEFLSLGPTPLIAAMRCYCCAKLGEYVDIPEELCQRANS